MVNISSVAGLDRRVEGSALGAEGSGLWSYNTSKSAANALTQQLAITLGKRFITVKSVSAPKVSSLASKLTTVCSAILPGVYPSKMTAYGLKNDKENKLAGSRESILKS